VWDAGFCGRDGLGSCYGVGDIELYEVVECFYGVAVGRGWLI
jgi:hypothetical protein